MALCPVVMALGGLVDCGLFDADEHCYEAEDIFTRYASQRMQTEKYIRWFSELDGKRAVRR